MRLALSCAKTCLVQQHVKICTRPLEFKIYTNFQIFLEYMNVWILVLLPLYGIEFSYKFAVYSEFLAP